jgi:hypothetical protein
MHVSSDNLMQWALEHQMVLSVTVPFAVYWLTAAVYEAIANSKAPWIDKYRIHPVEANKHNLVR